MITTEGNHSDPFAMASVIGETSNDYDFKVMHYDRYLAEMIAPLLSSWAMCLKSRAMGGYVLNMVMKELERIVLAKQLEHFNNPVLRWSMGNVLPKTDANGNIRPDKSNPANKIDPSVALILAVDAWMVDTAEQKVEAQIIVM